MARHTQTPVRWLFGDQLGPHHLGGGGPGPTGAEVVHPDPAERVLLVESLAVLQRRRFHRRKAHLVLSAIRHRAAELGERAVHLRTDTYREALAQLAAPVVVSQPTSHAADDFCRSHPDVTVTDDRGFATPRAHFEAWVRQRGERRLLLEDFYRGQRQRLGVLLEPDGSPVGGAWNFDADNRQPPPRGADRLGVAPPWQPDEDEIDRQVRADLDGWERSGRVAFVGRDGPRQFPVTRAEAREALDHFVRHRLASFGPFEDAMLARDPAMAHSLLSVPLNLGLLHPLEVVRAAEQAYRAGAAPIASVEGLVRQVIGWREYVWGLYWHLGPGYRTGNALAAHRPVPGWMWDLDVDAVGARCLGTVLREVRDTGWTHHIPRLMVLGNLALQRGWDPQQVTAWFHASFVDGYDWVMLPNVVGMALWADGGVMATKPYAAGGAYLNRMSDYCGDCRYDPRQRAGPDACPFTAGYWSFLARNEPQLRGNHRMSRPLAGLRRMQAESAGMEQVTAGYEEAAERGTPP